MNVTELEALRKKARNNMLLGFGITLAITIVLVIIFKSPLMIAFPLVLGFIFTNLINSKAQRKFSLALKETFVLKAFKSVFADLIYEPEKGIDESVIRNTGMINMGDRYSSNDYISGKYKNINVVLSDIHIEEKHETTDSNGHTSTTWVTIFRGRWMIFDFNKTFKANIQVCQNGFGNSRLNNWASKTKYKKVLMEDQAFNNDFRTYAQDEHEAFYILTPSFMEKIKLLTSNISGKLLFCFINNKLHVGLQNNKDSFEHSIFKKINEEEYTNEISKDLKSITNFVDELSLDNDLFRKEV